MSRLTDIGPWWRLIHKASRADLRDPSAPIKSSFGDDFETDYKGRHIENPFQKYIMLPFGEYQMGNLLALFYVHGFRGSIPHLPKQCNVNDGDWFHEIPYIIEQAILDFNLTLHSNSGWEFERAETDAGPYVKATPPKP